MNWGKKKIAGTEYDLSHLNPFVLPLICGDKSYRMQVSFGAHSFTREFKDGDTPDIIFMDGSKQRAFCVNRYAHSLHLPAAICQAVDGDICLSRDSLALNTSLPGLEGPYIVVFNIRKMDGKRFDARLYVRSAHHRPNLEPDLPRAKFRVVVDNKIKNRKIRWAKK